MHLYVIYMHLKKGHVAEAVQLIEKKADVNACDDVKLFFFLIFFLSFLEPWNEENIWRIWKIDHTMMGERMSNGHWENNH